MKPVFFISDVHLGAPNINTAKDIERRLKLQRFFEKVASEGSRLVIVGDLFDFWFEYKFVIPREHYWIYPLLSHLTSSGVKVDYVAGNHDFHIGDFFSSTLGVNVHRDGFSERIGEKNFMIIHGDGLAVKDAGYRILKKILRNPITLWLMRWIHPDIGFEIAKAFSKKSREYTSNKDFGEEDGMRIFAEKKISEGFDYVVMGHHHVPEIIHIKNGFYVNLGDWIENFTYGYFDGSSMKLLKWESKDEVAI
jgi:UDP-2,3-diacylglucosamine hydrolase